MTRRIVEETQRISIRTLSDLKIFDVSARSALGLDGKHILWVTTSLE